MLRNRLSKLRALWWGLGASFGLAVGALCPTSPLHATATDRQDTFAMATGIVEGGVEAIYTLDFLTGDLRGAVPAFNAPRSFSALYAHNVMQDLGVEVGKNPKFMIVTGTAPLRSAGQIQFGGAVIYVVEIGSGKLAMYAVAFSPAMMNRVYNGPPMDFTLLNVVNIRTTAVRGQ
jgi:hypothetical protein